MADDPSAVRAVSPERAPPSQVARHTDPYRPGRGQTGPTQGSDPMLQPPANDAGGAAATQAAPATQSVSHQSAAALPVQLRFLTLNGLAMATLQDAAALAQRWNCAPEAALFAAGLMTPPDYYRALGQELGMDYGAGALESGALEIAPEASLNHSLRAGVAPVRDRDGARRFVLAPQGPMLAALLGRTAGRPRPDGATADDSRRQGPGSAPDGFSRAIIVTPEALAEAVLRARAPAVASAAAHALADARPDLSCRDGLLAWQRLALLALAVMCPALAFTAPIAPAAICALIFLSQAVIRLAATLAAPRPGRRLHTAPAQPDCGELPPYSVVVPLYREANMAQHVLRSLERIDYPRALLDVMIVLEADDRETYQAFASLRLPSWIRLVVVPVGEPRTKPRALNVALGLARGRFLTVYDAEDAPDPDQLKKAVAAFRASGPEVACLQARLAIDNARDGWLPATFALEYAALFDVLLPGLARLGFPVALGGTSNHFRVEVLRQAMGWDAWNVTEDADLGLRLARFGWRVADLDSTTIEEAPVRLSPWMRQRTRWLKGWLQVLITHSRSPAAMARELGWLNAWAAMGQCLGVLLSALCYPFLTAIMAWECVAAYAAPDAPGVTRAGLSLAATVALVGGVAFSAPLVVGARRRGWRLLWTAPLLPLYYLLVSAAAWRALLEQIRYPARWNKTDHGAAQSSLSGRLTCTSGTQPPPLRADASG